MINEIKTVGIIVESGSEILILLRNDDKIEGNKWGLPAGKVKENETEINTAIRELYEETGYKAKENELKFIKTYSWTFDNLKINFPLFILKLNQKFNVKINPKEHKDYKWIKPIDCYKKNNLIHGLHDLLNIMYEIK